MEEQAWKTGKSSPKPILSIAALILGLVCTVAALVVLLVSDGQPISGWTVKPAVLLAIFSTIANSMVAVALSKGLAITWWRRALHGATVAEIHRTWECGQSFFGALQHAWRFEKVSVASLFAMLMLVNGPLLQRSSTVRSFKFETMINLSLPAAEELPSGFTGSMDPSSMAIA